MKFCHKCNTNKTEEEFNKNSTKKDGLSTCCKECNKQNLRNHYQSNKKYYKDKRKLFYKGIAKKFQDLKSLLSCELCTESSPECLDFHHVDSTKKEQCISQLVRYSWSKIVKELKKCIPLCSNCHKKIHSNRIKLPSRLMARQVTLNDKTEVQLLGGQR